MCVLLGAALGVLGGLLLVGLWRVGREDTARHLPASRSAEWEENAGVGGGEFRVLLLGVATLLWAVRGAVGV